MSWLFGKPKLSPKEQVREWTHELNKERRLLDRERAKLEREEAKVAAEVKKAAKSGHVTACRTLAKSIVRSQKQRERLLEAGTRINSVVLSMKTHLATSSVMGHMEKSTAVLKSMSKLISIPELQGVAREMSKEMMKAGLIEEMIEDAISVTDTEDLETEADAEVDRVLFEVTAGQLGSMTEAKKREEKKEEVEEANVDDEKEIDEMKARLASLG